MLRGLVLTSLRHRHLVLLIAAGLLVWGGFKTARAPLDVFPEFVQPQVDIQAEAPGLVAEQVEQLVTRPIELAVGGITDLETVRSESIAGLSTITVLFKEGADIHRARQSLAEQLATLTGQLPAGVRTPTLSPLTSSTMDLLKIGLVSETVSQRDLRTFADWTLKPRLLSVAGVAHVNVFGGELEQLQVQVDPARLADFGLSLAEIVDATKAAAGVYGTGYVDTPAQRIVIQADAPALTPEELGEMPIKNAQPVVRLRDVAHVSYGDAPKFGDALVMGKPGVLLTLRSQYGANTLDSTHALETALEEMKPILTRAGIQFYPRLHRPATFIENALGNLRHSLLLGAGFVAIVLLLFLLHLRTAFIAFVSIPLSLLAAAVVLTQLGFTLNTMTLGGFAVAIGVVVDDAIIDVENILRRLRENAALPAPRAAWEVVLDASMEVRGSIVYATLIVAVVFLPVLTMSGLQGRFFAPLGLAFVLSTLASLAVALTVTPALCLVLLRGSAKAEPRWLGAVRRFYRDWLLALARRPILTALAALLVIAGAGAVALTFHGELLPDFVEGHLVIGMKMQAGTSLAENLRLGRLISEKLLEIPQVATVAQQAGRAEQGEDTWGPEQCEFHLELKPGLTGDEQEEAQSKIRELLHEVPGIETEVLTFLGDRIHETMSGETAAVVVNVFGPELDPLDRVAQQILTIMAKVPGNAEAQLKLDRGAPTLSIHLRPERLRQYGFRAQEVLQTVETAFQGPPVAQIAKGDRTLDLAVTLTGAARRDPECVGDLLLTNDDRQKVPLRTLADVTLTNSRPAIDHEGARRRQAVTCNVEGRSVAEFVAEARRAVTSAVKLPPGVYVEWTGAAQAQAAAHAELLTHSAAAGLLVLILLGLVFPRPSHLVLVLLNLPFALVGGVLAIFASGSEVSLGALVGFVTLFGISARNSIMLISHYRHLLAAEGATWSLETLARGAEERFVPIVMTALVTALGVLPLALGRGAAGQEIEAPMAVVILGGLATSTALNLLVLPALAWKWGRFDLPATEAGPAPIEP